MTGRKLAETEKLPTMLVAMSIVDHTNGFSLAPPGNSVRPVDRAQVVPTTLFRFGTRQLLWFFAGTSAFFAALVSSSGSTALVLTVTASIVAAHVAATAIGTRLRSRADAEHRFEAEEQHSIAAIATAAERQAQVSAVHAQPRSPWHARGSTTLPWLRRFVVAAIVIGGFAGASVLAITVGYRTSPAGIVIGGISSAVLSGWFAFLCGSFYGVFRHGFRDAAAAVPPINPTE